MLFLLISVKVVMKRDRTYGQPLRTQEKIWGKNSKKIKTLPKSSKKKKNCEEVRYLGFIIDTAIVGPESLTHAIINLSEDRNVWHSIDLRAQFSSPKGKDSALRYFRTIFFLSVKTWLLYKSQKKLEKRTIVIKKNEIRFSKIGLSLRRGARKDKVKGAFKDFPMLRMAIHNSLFAGSGANGPLNVIWKGGQVPDAIFFWSPKKLQNVFSELKPNLPHQKIEIKNLTPVTELTPESLDMLAVSLVYSDLGNTWQDLYRKALKNSLSADIFIELSASQVMKIKEVEEQSNSQSTQSELFKSNMKSDAIGVLGIFENNSRVLLTGSSGSGKTTTLRYISRLFAFGEQKIKGQEVLPIIVPMKWFGIWPKERKCPPTISAYVAFWIRKTIDDYVDISDLQNCDLFGDKKSRQQAHGNREKMLEMISQQVEAFLFNNSNDFSNFVFLFDAYNEIPRAEKYNADQQLQKFLRQINKYVISSRRYDLDKILPGATKFEIQELNNDQILSYLIQSLMEKGEEVFTNQIEKDLKILSMAQNPFYLFLITQEVKKNPNTKIPSNRAELIQNFIMDSIERKNREKVYVNDKIRDDLIYIVLPRIAKWSLDIATASKGGEFLPFTKSQQFKEFQGSYSDVFDSLEKAELCGILKSSGLLQESRENFGYPEFFHNNIRDHFAAIYLTNINAEELQKQLPYFLEYFAWDEPLIQFLELNLDKDLTRQIIDTVITKDIVLASLCTRHARTMDEDICIEFERKIRNSEIYKQIEPLIQHTISHTCTRKLQRNLLINVLCRLPIEFLLELINEPYQDGPSEIYLWIAIGEIVNVDDLSWLMDLRNSLAKKSLVDRFCVLYVIAQIPTYDAFKVVVDIYKNLQQNKDDDPELARFFDASFLTLISYSPSLSELTSEFPFEKSPNEFHVFFRKIRKAFGNELALLEKLMFGNHNFVSADACRLFVKSAGKESIPILFDWLMINIAGLNPVNSYPELQDAILDILRDVAPDETVKRITNYIKGTVGYTRNLNHWKALSRIQTKESLKYFVRCVSDNSSEIASYFCADQLENWPNKNDVISEFESYTKDHVSPNDGAILFGAWLGIDKFLAQASSLFNKIYSIAVLEMIKEFDQIDPIFEESFKINHEDWYLKHQQNMLKKNISLIPMAIRVVQEYDPEIIKKLLNIIQWAIESISSEKKHSVEVLFESIIQVVLKLVKVANLSRSSKIVEDLLKSHTFENILCLLQKKVNGFCTYKNEQYYYEKLESALIYFCDAIPNKYVPQLLLLNQKLFVNSIMQSLSSNEVNLKVSSNIILCLCNRADYSLVSEFIQSLHSTLSVVDNQENRKIIGSLIEKIKSEKRRRFLSIFDTN